MAFDLLHQTREWASFYSLEKKEAFVDYIDNLCKDFPIEARAILLKKYAYPLINQMNIE